MRVVAFYTKDTKYEEEAEIWKESFKSCNTLLFPIKNEGSWELNCGKKSSVLLEALHSLNEPILYVDIDARLMRDLEEIPEPELPGFCFLNKNKVKNYGRELASGTIYFPQTVASFKILIEWTALQKRFPTVWDQKTLQDVVESNKYNYQILPPEWLGVSRHAELANPIIYHTQASRRLKSTIK
jgi:hypothetical protein